MYNHTGEISLKNLIEELRKPKLSVHAVITNDSGEPIGFLGERAEPTALNLRAARAIEHLLQLGTDDFLGRMQMQEKLLEAYSEIEALRAAPQGEDRAAFGAHAVDCSVVK